MEVTNELLANAEWRKAERSGDSGDCLEVAPLPGGQVGIRDTEHLDQPPFVVSASVWGAFIDGAKRGEFDF
ncbi:DUF397 domain-containing protein [Sinosporangium siamense]|uniref:DUF397 domain-containing protein n=1 Tax=Sinosporangium siamense TaxID=1367973 RepID=A0A919RBI0_9ACTN|nr:DUF397 domain-containing protein [Sinosporangium siamense]GII90623.1 hypothetical protein Ssi02_08540 [Sinosporangium siamense]